jgi:arylsulfatase A-like enzyme
MLLACGNQIAGKEQVRDAHIEDIAPTILHLLGCQVPTDMDGQVLTDLLNPEWLAAHPVGYRDSQVQPEATDALTPEEEENLMEHLRNLGYVG